MNQACANKQTKAVSSARSFICCLPARVGVGQLIIFNTKYVTSTNLSWLHKWTPPPIHTHIHTQRRTMRRERLVELDEK